MALIHIEGIEADKYRGYLKAYRTKTGKEPGPLERTEAFLCARSKDPWRIPDWCR